MNVVMYMYTLSLFQFQFGLKLIVIFADKQLILSFNTSRINIYDNEYLHQIWHLNLDVHVHVHVPVGYFWHMYMYMYMYVSSYNVPFYYPVSPVPPPSSSSGLPPIEVHQPTTSESEDDHTLPDPVSLATSPSPVAIHATAGLYQNLNFSRFERQSWRERHNEETRRYFSAYM